EIPTPYDDSWVSWYTYDILFHHNGLGSYDTDDPPALLIRGSIDPTGVATLKPAYVISVNHPIAETFPEDDTKGLHNIVGYDAVGNPLLVHDFEPFKVSVHDETYGKVLDIREAIPIVPNVERLAVFKGTQLLGELVNRFPGATPSVSITMPTGGSVWPVGVPQTVRWIASSPSGLPLVAQVQYSRDGGTTRITLARDITGSELVVDPDEVAGSSQAVIYVGVSDGMNVATATA